MHFRRTGGAAVFSVAIKLNNAGTTFFFTCHPRSTYTAKCVGEAISPPSQVHLCAGSRARFCGHLAGRSGAGICKTIGEKAS